MPQFSRIPDRLQDRFWTEITRCMALRGDFHESVDPVTGSISASMDWPLACSAFAKGQISSRNFRRLRAVMEVVETLGPSEGRHHASLIRNSCMAGSLNDERLRDIASWGNPINWPGFLLGTARPFAPSTLRYLSHAIWLAEQKLMAPGSGIVEIGVGYGGLAAINAMISGSHTLLVDLPAVEQAAMKMLDEIGLPGSASMSCDGGIPESFDCFISNYALTELTRELQEMVIDSYAAKSRHGLILSNAKVFSSRIGGMDNQTLVESLRSRGLGASISNDNCLLSRTDIRMDSVLITW